MLLTVPTAAERAGDFSGLLTNASGAAQIKIYDPLTTTQTGPNTYTRQQFSYDGVANVIPTNRLTQVGKNYLSLITRYPMPSAQSSADWQLPHAHVGLQRSKRVEREGRLQHQRKNMLFACAIRPAIRAAAPRISLARTLPALSVWCTVNPAGPYSTRGGGASLSRHPQEHCHRIHPCLLAQDPFGSERRSESATHHTHAPGDGF